MQKGALLVFLAMAAPVISTSPAVALPRDNRGGSAPLDRLLPEIRRTHPGQFYDAEGPMPGPNGQLQYRLKWMTPDGRIVWLDADAHTGRITGSETGRSAPSLRYNSPAPQSRFGAGSRLGHDKGRTYGSPYSGGQGRGGDERSGRDRLRDGR